MTTTEPEDKHSVKHPALVLLMLISLFYFVSEYTITALNHPEISDDKHYYFEAYKYKCGFDSSRLMENKLELNNGISVKVFGDGKYKSYVRDYTYTPFFAQLLVPLVTIINYNQFRYLWGVLNNLELILFIILSLKCIGRYSFTNYGFLFIIICFFNPIKENFFEGQINILILLLVTLHIYYEMQDKKLYSCITLSLAILFKIYPIVFLPYYLFQKKFKSFGYTIGALAIFIIISIIFFGYSPWVKFIEYNLTSDILSSIVVHNISIRSYLSIFIYNDKIALLIHKLFLISFSLVFFILFSKRTKSIHEKLFDYSFLVMLFNFLSPHVYVHHFIFLLIPLALILFSDTFKLLYPACRIIFIVTLSLIAGNNFYRQYFTLENFMFIQFVSLIVFCLNLIDAKIDMVTRRAIFTS